MTYSYSCPTCGEFDVDQRITEAALDVCPTCRGPHVKRLISGAPRFSLVSGASGGWAETGYAKTSSQRSYEAKTGRKLTPRAS